MEYFTIMEVMLVVETNTVFTQKVTHIVNMVKFTDIRNTEKLHTAAEYDTMLENTSVVMVNSNPMVNTGVVDTKNFLITKRVIIVTKVLSIGRDIIKRLVSSFNLPLL